MLTSPVNHALPDGSEPLSLLDTPAMPMQCREQSDSLLQVDPPTHRGGEDVDDRRDAAYLRYLSCSVNTRSASAT